MIDTCNPFVWRDGEVATWAREKGAGLASAELLPGARIVRAFNAIGYARMAAAHEQPFCLNDEHLIAFVSDTDFKLNVPTFGLEDIHQIVDFIEKHFLSHRLSAASAE